MITDEEKKTYRIDKRDRTWMKTKLLTLTMNFWN